MTPIESFKNRTRLNERPPSVVLWTPRLAEAWNGLPKTPREGDVGVGSSRGPVGVASSEPGQDGGVDGNGDGGLAAGQLVGAAGGGPWTVPARERATGTGCHEGGKAHLQPPGGDGRCWALG
jgi:hypothetical protein